MQSYVALTLGMLLTGCAVNPAEVSLSDPVGIGAAMNRCTAKPKEERVLPDWFKVFGPAFACR